VAPEIWNNLFVEIFAGVFFIRDVGSSILLQAVDHLYRQAGVYQGKPSFPTIRQLYQLLIEWQKEARNSRKREAFGSLLNRLDGLLTNWPTGLDCSRGMCPPELIGRHVILAMNGLTDQLRAFVVCLIFLWTYAYCEGNNLRGDNVLRYLLVIDEAELVLGKDIRQALGRAPDYFQVLPRLREFGIGLLLATQSPSGLDERAVLSLAQTRIVKRLSRAEESDCIGDSLGWSPERKTFCRSMPSDLAAVATGVRQPDSALVRVPYVHVDKNVDWNEIRRIMEPRIRREFTIAPPVPLPSQQGQAAGGSQGAGVDVRDVKRLLTDVLNRPHLPKSERLSALFGGSSSQCQRIAKFCVEQDLVKEFQVHAGGRSGMLTLWRLKAKGYDFVGMPRQVLPGIGDVKHQYLQDRVWRKLKTWGLSPQIEMRRCGKRVDVGVDIAGRLIAFEIAITASNEVSNVQKDVAAGFDLIVVLPENQKVQGTIERKFKKELSPHYLQHTKVIAIPDFLNRVSIPW